MHKKILFAFGLLFITAAAIPAAVDARHRYHANDRSSTLAYNQNPWKNTPTDVSASSTSKPLRKPSKPSPAPAPTKATATSSLPSASGQEVSMKAYVTGYSYWDNTPAGTAGISHGVIHAQAGGTGTYNDPITLAVGHSIVGGKDILDYPAGTKFYLPYLQKYAIVEDTCGDGSAPQNGPCHTGYQGNVWIDIYVDGQNVSRSSSDDCMDTLTGVHTIIKNPDASHTVKVGSITGTGCLTF
jgi:hypothetical protein